MPMPLRNMLNATETDSDPDINFVLPYSPDSHYNYQTPKIDLGDGMTFDPYPFGEGFGYLSSHYRTPQASSPRLPHVCDFTPDKQIRASPRLSVMITPKRKAFVDVKNARQILAHSGSTQAEAEPVPEPCAPFSAAELVKLARLVSGRAVFLQPYGHRGSAWQSLRDELIKVPVFKHKSITAHRVQTRAETLVVYKKVCFMHISVTELINLG